MAEEVREALIYHYRLPEDRARMAKWWCQSRYNGDTRPEILDRVRQDLESLNHMGLAWVYQEARDTAGNVRATADNYDPWR